MPSFPRHHFGELRRGRPSRGNTDARVVVINGRDMDVLQGELHVACAAYGLKGDAQHESCLP